MSIFLLHKMEAEISLGALGMALAKIQNVA